MNPVSCSPVASRSAKSRVINKYGASVSPYSMPASILKKSVSPSVVYMCFSVLLGSLGFEF